MTEGEQLLQIKKHTMRVLLDPSAIYNVITEKAQKRAGLISHEVPNTSQHPTFEDKEPINIMYCANVPLEADGSPILPGIFLVVTETLPGGVDLIVGKPWLAGVQKRYNGYRFTTPQYTPLKKDDVILPYTTDLEEPMELGTSSESINDLSGFMTEEKYPTGKQFIKAMESDSSWDEITDKPWQQTLEKKPQRHKWDKLAKQRGKERASGARAPPAMLGGSFAKAL